MSVGHNSANARLRSFIDRVLRLKEEQDTLAEDIREVYAEAKAEGYDKTAMGELVAYLRKVEKKGADAVAEKSAIFDLYKDAYENAVGTVVATHAHAPEAPTPEAIRVFAAYRANEAKKHPAPISGDDDGHPGIPSSEADQVNGEGNQGGVSPIIQDAHSEQETASAPQDRNEPVSESGASVTDFQPPAFLKREAAPLRPHCMEPDNCGGYGAKHCHACLKAAGLEA